MKNVEMCICFWKITPIKKLYLYFIPSSFSSELSGFNCLLLFESDGDCLRKVSGIQTFLASPCCVS